MANGMGDIFGGMTQLGLGIYGASQSSKERDAARKMLELALREYEALGYPPDLSKELAYGELRQSGVINPQLEQELKQEDTSLNQIQQNPELKQMRISALEQLKQRAATGLTPEERAQMNALQREVDRSANAQMQSIQQQAQARGIAGSGQELAGKMIAAQSGANRALVGAEQIGSQASRRALESLLQGTNLAGQMSEEQLALDAKKAEASDLIKRFNIENAIQRQTRNVNRANEAQRLNLAEKQRLQDYNTMMKNQEMLRANEARRSNWQDRLGLAGAKAGIRSGQYKAGMDQASSTAGGYQNIATGAGGLVKSGFNYFGQPNVNNQSNNFQVPDGKATITNNIQSPYSPEYWELLQRKNDPRE